MPNDILTRAIEAAASGEHLTADHASTVLGEIMGGRASDVQTGAFLIALRAKGETVPELIGLARTMRSLATPVETAATTWSTRRVPEGDRPQTSRPRPPDRGRGRRAVPSTGNRSSTLPLRSADVLEPSAVDIDRTPIIGHRSATSRSASCSPRPYAA